MGTALSTLPALVIFGALRDLLIKPWTRLSILEQTVLIWLVRLCQALGAGPWHQRLVALLAEVKKRRTDTY